MGAGKVGYQNNFNEQLKFSVAFPHVNLNYKYQCNLTDSLVLFN